MNSRFLALLAFLLCSIEASLSAAVFERSVRKSSGDLPVVVLRGTAEERARAFGALCGREFLQMLEKAMVPAVNAKSDQAWDELAAATGRYFAFPKEFQQQAEAFIDGLRQALPADERRIQALGREVQVSDLLALHAFPDLAVSGRVPLGGCSSFSAWGARTEDGRTIAGRNLDYFTFPGRIPVVVIAQEPAEKGLQKTIEVSVPGILGASTALNEQGVFLSLNDEAGLPPSRNGGWIPRVVPLRRAIETAGAATAVEDVARALRDAPLAAGGIVHVSFPSAAKSASGPAVIEWDGNEEGGGVTVRRGSEQAIHCTNHYLERRNRDASGSSKERFDALKRGFETSASAGEKIDLARAKKLLDAAAVRGRVSTYLSVIARPDERRLWVAVAPRPGASATDGEWTEIAWKEVFAP